VEKRRRKYGAEMNMFCEDYQRRISSGVALCQQQQPLMADVIYVTRMQRTKAANSSLRIPHPSRPPSTNPRRFHCFHACCCSCRSPCED